MTDLTTIRVLVALSEDGSLRSAATKLETDKNTVSRHMSILEDRAGTPLFVRKSTGTELTKAGRLLVDSATDVLGSLRRFDEVLASIKTKHTGPVTVSAPEGIGSYLLAPLNIDDVTPLPIRGPLPAISILPPEHPADIEILFVAPGQPIPRNSTCMVRRLGTMRFLPVMSRRFLTANALPETHKALSTCPMFDHLGYGMSPAFSRWCDVMSGRQPLMTVTSSSALHRAVMTGRGVALLPDFSSVIDDAVICANVIEKPEVELWSVAESDILRIATVRQTWDTIHNSFTASPWFN